MTSNAQILLYNFKSDDRTRQIRRYLNKAGISVRIVEAPEFLHPLGYLFGLAGFSACPQFNLGGNFSEEMLVLKDFSGQELDAFLSFFKEASLAPVHLKAVLTPVTQHWNSLQLHDELTQEHRMMQERRNG